MLLQRKVVLQLRVANRARPSRRIGRILGAQIVDVLVVGGLRVECASATVAEIRRDGVHEVHVMVEVEFRGETGSAREL